MRGLQWEDCENENIENEKIKNEKIAKIKKNSLNKMGVEWWGRLFENGGGITIPLKFCVTGWFQKKKKKKASYYHLNSNILNTDTVQLQNLLYMTYLNQLIHGDLSATPKLTIPLATCQLLLTLGRR